MATVEENRAARALASREVARDAAEAYRAAKKGLLEALEDNRKAVEDLDEEPLTRAAYETRRSELRDESRQLTFDARDFGVEMTTVADKLGVSRMTVYDWLNEP